MNGSCDANKSRQTAGSDREKVARGMARLGRFPFTRAASAPARKTCAKRKAGGAPAIRRPHLSVAVNELVGRERSLRPRGNRAAAPAVPQGVKVIHRRAEWSSERPVGWRVLHGPRRSPIPPLIGADRPLAFGHPMKSLAFVTRMGAYPFLSRSARVRPARRSSSRQRSF